jgi:hypothetical protein
MSDRLDKKARKGSGRLRNWERGTRKKWSVLATGSLQIKRAGRPLFFELLFRVEECKTTKEKPAAIDSINIMIRRNFEQSDHSPRNNLNHLMIILEAISLASLSLKVFDQNSKKKNTQTVFSFIWFVFLQKIDRTDEKDASDDLLLMIGQTNDRLNLKAYGLKLLKESEQLILLEYIPSACVSIKSRGSRSFEVIGFVMFQLDLSARGGINRNHKIIAVGPTSLALRTLSCKQNKQSISRNITSHSRDTVALDPLIKQKTKIPQKRLILLGLQVFEFTSRFKKVKRHRTVQLSVQPD